MQDGENGSGKPGQVLVFPNGEKLDPNEVGITYVEGSASSGISATAEIVDVKALAQEARDREDFVSKQELVRVVREKLPASDIIDELVKEISEELAHLKFERKKAAREGKNTASISISRVASLRSLAEVLMKRLENARAEQLNLKSPRFREILHLWMEFLHESMKKAEVEDQVIDLVFRQMEADMVDWEKRVLDVLQDAMPIKEPTFKSALSGEVSSFLDRKRKEKTGGSDGDVEFLSIIDFIERFKLLPYGLYPVQKFIVKMYYNVPLDDVEKTIIVKDMFGEKILYEFTEVEYLRYLHDSGRCNIAKQDGKERRELILVLGRRSGKSALSAIFAAYELYKLICRGHPQAFYGMPGGSEIRVLCVANDKEQAAIVYGDMQSHVGAVDYFKSSLANETQTFMRFRTESDKERFGPKGRSTITATFKSSIAKGLRGRGIMCAILDEIAFFIEDGNSGAERIYRAISPSLAQFSPKDPKNKTRAIGPTEGRMILISSPDAKEGFFYRVYQQAMSKDKGSADMLVIQAPTWEVNPSLDRSYYEKEYHKDPKSFVTEHGAEFSDRVRGWIEDARDLQDCISPSLRPVNRGYPREPYFAGVDLGLVKDGTSISLTKIGAGKIELAYHETWYAGKRWKDTNPHLESPMTPYALTLQDQARLDMGEIAKWFRALTQRFFIVKGLFDQWSGIAFEQELHKNGLRQFETRNFFASDSSYAYQTFKGFMYNKQISLYDYPIPESMEGLASGRHSPLIQELLELQATSGGKNIIVVEAPAAPGKHDDASDALVRSVLLASEYISANPGILERGGYIPSEPIGPVLRHIRPGGRIYGAASSRRTVSRIAPKR